MTYSYEQIGNICISLDCTSDVQVGQVCQMYTSDCVCKAGADRIFDGVVASKKDSRAGVVVHGFVTVPFTGTAPSVGYRGLLSDGQGGVYSDEEGKNYLIVSVDTANKTVTFLL